MTVADVVAAQSYPFWSTVGWVGALLGVVGVALGSAEWLVRSEQRYLLIREAEIRAARAAKCQAEEQANASASMAEHTPPRCSVTGPDVVRQAGLEAGPHAPRRVPGPVGARPLSGCRAPTGLSTGGRP